MMDEMCTELAALVLAWQDRGCKRGEMIAVMLSTVSRIVPPAAKDAAVVLLQAALET